MPTTSARDSSRKRGKPFFTQARSPFTFQLTMRIAPDRPTSSSPTMRASQKKQAKTSAPLNSGAHNYDIFRAGFHSAHGRRPSSTCERERNMAAKGNPPTKSEVLAHITKDTGLTRQQVNAVFESLKGIMRKSLRSHGLFTLPGLMKLKVVKKPATKAREGINPFTGEKMMFKAKPASKKVRVLPLKTVKDMVN